jgi:DNA polymerase-3 subunit delta'
MNIKQSGSYLIVSTASQAKRIIYDIAIKNKIKKSDLFIIDESNGNIKIEKIREIKKKLLLRSQNNFKLFCILDSQNLTLESANSLLKILEEPNSQTIIILFSENMYKILPTIRSRCKLIQLNLEKNIDKEYIKILETLKLKKRLFEKFKLVDQLVKDEIDVSRMLEFWLQYLKTRENEYLKIKIIFEYLKVYKNSINKKLFLDNLFIRI